MTTHTTTTKAMTVPGTTTRDGLDAVIRILPQNESRIIRPNAHLPGQSRLVAAAFTVPVFAAMLWFAIPRGSWPRVVVAIALLGAVYALAHRLFSRVRIVIEHDGLTENGFFTQNRRISAKRIASALIIPVYRGQSLDSSPQLFLLDARGDLLLRMRGQYWNPEHLATVATAYDVPTRTLTEPLTPTQLRTDFGDYVYWFERWPWIAALTAGAGLVALTVLLIVIASNPRFLAF